ncbi:MAG: sigma-70 family RNA polymerase sigma factor, partial [Candidatus Peribacteraceae bacterium]|nr:sigma-70 family RNA polymerase sigma factor [Candidatus Peribacteraceae bacterium]
KDARLKIIKDNLSLVVSLAKKYYYPRMNIEFLDFVEEGNMSLMKAVRKYDFAKGFKFSTYATWSIINNYTRSIPEENEKRNRAIQINGDEEDGERYNGQIADFRTNEFEILAQNTVDKENIEIAMQRLNNRQQFAIRMRFGLSENGEEILEPKTLKEIGDLIGVTKGRVGQLLISALNKLKKALHEKNGTDANTRNKNNTSGMLTKMEIMEILNIDIQTIDQWRKKGLVALRNGNRLVFRIDDILLFLESKIYRGHNKKRIRCLEAMRKYIADHQPNTSNNK